MGLETCMVQKIIIIQCLLCLVELKDGEIKLGGLRLDQDGCSCAAICNEHNEVGLWRLWWFNLAISWLPLLVD